MPVSQAVDTYNWMLPNHVAASPLVNSECVPPGRRWPAAVCPLAAQ